MKLIIPLTVDDTVLMSSTVLENDYALWSNTATYAVSQQVIRTTTHKVYQSLVAGNVGNTPETNPSKWSEVGPTNKWAPFDLVVGTTMTASATDVTYVFKATSICSALSLLDVQCTSIHVVVTVDGNVLYDKTFSMSDSSNTADWYSYLFTPYATRTALTLSDLPKYTNAIISVTLHSSSGTVKLGNVVLGKLFDVGPTKYGLNLGIQDYSTKTANTFGAYTITKRAYSKRMKVGVEIPFESIDWVYQTLASLRSTPVLYIGTDVLESTNVFGFYKDFDITIPYPTTADCTLEIEGLI
jgi:hypothetical protein